MQANYEKICNLETAMEAHFKRLTAKLDYNRISEQASSSNQELTPQYDAKDLDKWIPMKNREDFNCLVMYLCQSEDNMNNFVSN